MKIIYKITKNDENKELKIVLKKKLYISSKLLLKLKQTNSIFVNNSPTFVSNKVKKGDEILIDLDNMQNILNKSNIKFSDKYELDSSLINILYEDDYILIVDKPAKIAVHPSCSNYEHTLSNMVANYLEKQNIYSIHIITRLDKDTSGICIFAKNEYIQELFVRKKDDISFKKEYIVVVNGIINDDHGIIEKPIARKEDSIITREINYEKGDYAKTEYEVIKRNLKKNYTTLKAILHTGRTHQIRVHFAYNGHILLGDDIYAKDLNYTEDIRKYINRQALHCHKVSFNHPITNEKIEIESKIPVDIKRLL